MGCLGTLLGHSPRRADWLTWSSSENLKAGASIGNDTHGWHLMRSFDSPGQFAAFLAGVIVAMPSAEKRGLEAAAKLIEAEAKAEIGHYQEAAGPFAKWDELSDVTKSDRVAQGWPENNPLLRSGELLNSIGHKVGDREAVVGSSSMIAVYQEFGTERIPPRSFLGGAAVRKGKEAASLIGRAIDATLTGRNS